MGKLSIEEKAKAYDEALERARALYNDKNEIGYANAESVLEEVFPLLKESKDERIRKEIINYFAKGKEYLSLCSIGKDDILAWLENIPYTIDHEKREGFHLGYKAALEKQGESSDKIHYWTEEEIEPIISDYLRGAEHYGGMIGRLRCLKPKSLEKQGEQKPAWSEWDEERIKNILSVLDVQVCWDGATGKKGNPYQKEIDWLKSLKPQKQWKPSEKQMKALDAVRHNNSYNVRMLDILFHDLKKLTE